MSWRPDDWVTPQSGIRDELFEAGADAMLEALKKKGNHVVFEDGKPVEGRYIPHQTYGWQVFIPEAESKDTL